MKKQKNHINICVFQKICVPLQRFSRKALRKISNNPGLGDVEREDIAQMYIIHPKKMAQGLMQFLSGLFATHPSTEERIRILEQF